MVAVSLPLFVQAEATENGHAVIDPTLRYQKLEGGLPRSETGTRRKWTRSST